jgi:hypothetical protein
VGRGTTIVVVLILATTYALRGHIIIFSKGVPGWGYGPPTMASTVPPDLRSVSAETANLLQQGLRPEIAHHLKTAGYLKGEVFLLHFDDGTIKPGNFGLTVNTWPTSAFTVADGRFKHEQKFIELLRHSLEKRRRGYQDGLPIVISYPNHINYQPIDYRSYPPAATLRTASLWRVDIYVQPAPPVVKIVGATEIARAEAHR